MNVRALGYWIPTALFAFALTGSGLFNLSGAPEIQQAMDHLGFPAWFPTWLGAWKLAGVAVLLLPGLPRVKEWATAGFTVLLSSASLAHLSAGDPAGNVVTPLVLLALLLTSWALRPASRRLGSAPGFAPVGGLSAAK